MSTATVVALEVWADLRTEDGLPPGVHLDVHERAVLDDGRRLVLDDQHRGVSIGVHPPGTDPWSVLTPAMVESTVAGTVLPDDDDGEEHPWAWLVERLATHGVSVTQDTLRRVPYRVVLGPRVRERLRLPADPVDGPRTGGGTGRDADPAGGLSGGR